MESIFEQDASSLIGQQCELLEDPNTINFVLSIVIFIGILVSYLPQHYRIIRRQTSEGISPLFILLGSTSCTCAFANVLTLPASRADIFCCKFISGLKCAAGLLGILQVAAQWVCFTVILILFLIYASRDSRDSNNNSSASCSWQKAIAVGAIYLIHALTVLIVSMSLLYFNPSYLEAWADILGIIAAILAVIQYVPQIQETWVLGHVGSLSIPMMLIQTPGSFVWSASLAVRLGLDGWSTWGLFLITGCLQCSILVMGVFFELKLRTSDGHKSHLFHQNDNEHGRERIQGLNENSPLLDQ